LTPANSREHRSGVAYTSRWPIEEPASGAGTREGAQSAKVALNRRIEVLAKVPMFAGLSKRQLQALARASTSHRWPAGALIVAEGSNDQYCYVVVDGTVEVVRHGQSVAVLGPGEFFGEIAILDPGPRTATVMTATDVVAVCLHRQGLVDVALKDPQVSLRMLGALARRVREMTEQRSD
jgi:CRP/FNR family transcriptional regulator, cyclic AMP receptor protein